MNIKITIEGTSPLLLNRFTDEAAEKATSGNRTSTIGDRGTPREIATAALYTGSQDGKPIMPAPNIARCIIDGGTFFKAGKSKVTTLKTSIIPSCVDLDEVEYLILHKEPWCVDTRAVRIPATGGRILAHRPCFNDWRISFGLALDTDILSIKLLREIIDASGKRIGIGAFRPACKGPFGRFVVTSWEEST